MHKTIIFILVLALIYSCMEENQLYVQSPNGKIGVTINPEKQGLYYSIDYKNSPLIHKSLLGMVLADSDTITDDLVVLGTETASVDETWEQPWGECRFVRDYYNKMMVTLQEKNEPKRKISITFKVFNDGVGFRYSIPKQDGIDSIVIMDELTEFEFADDHTAWWIPAFGDNRYEYLYNRSNINSLGKAKVHTPLTMETKNGVSLSIHQANLTHYASMTLEKARKNTLKCNLVPWSDGTKVKTSAPMESPWRTIQVADNPGDLITSTLILNLNEPNQLDDVSWIKPLKYMGIWWGMHIGKYTFWESGEQGATTENAKYYIDFASDNGIKYLLIEGWNKGWTPEWYQNTPHIFNFTECAEGFDFQEVVNYARSKGGSLIGYHETGANIENYLSQIDAGMAMYSDAGIHNIKIGQVGARLQLKEWHQSQYGVEYYRYVLEKAAKYKLAVNFHEPIIPTGLQRTWPNLMSGEGARGQEYNAWSEGNPPEHACVLPFTRLLAGPMDFTPGIFKIKPTHVHTTLAKQLALYVTIYSPIQMLADLPENYDRHPAFQFLKDVPVDWQETKVINAKIGDYLTIARKDRDSNDWFLGSITDEQAREIEITLDFLDKGATYMATIYADGEGAAFDDNPEAYRIYSQEVNNSTELKILLAPGGGCAIRFAKK
jgi:alpha-glucosidase